MDSGRGPNRRVGEVPTRGLSRWRILGAACAGIAILGLPTGRLAAQDTFPAGPVRLVVPFGAGGPTDVLARIVGDQLAKAWGRPMVVENRTGAGGSIGAALVARAPATGTTLLLASGTPIGTMEVLGAANLPYRTDDFEPIAVLASTPLVAVVNAKRGIRTLRELVQQARMHPGALTFGSTGNGSTSHLAVELFNTITGIEMLHVPYKDGNSATKALIAGEIDLYMSGASSVVTAAQVPIATMWTTRLARYPELPTAAEQGITGADYYAWYGIFAPRGTPRPILEKLERDFIAAASAPDSARRLAGLGFEPLLGGREALAREVRENVEQVRLVRGAKPSIALDQ